MRSLRIAALLLLAAPLTVFASLAAQNVITIDARMPSQAAEPSSYHGGTLSSRSGHSIGINSRYLTMDSRPWLPVMGEFHYSRVPEAEWEEQLLKMKAAGVQIVSTYVIWIHHEEIKGDFDWTGQRDLRHFVELCGRHGLFVIVRIGPWTHGEARNGGLPDWVLTQGPTRRNDPAFMASVAKLYGQVGAQVEGLLWKDGGPIIGVQIENEYSARGPHEGEEYILALKKLAIKSGLDVPLYTVTGWDHAVVPKGEFLPVFGGYPDAPWDASVSALPPNEVYMFRFGSRVAGDGAGDSGNSEADRFPTPFFTAEMGGGVQDTYHRRPVIKADDVAAMVPVMLGSGANLYGYYMFQGGENPEGSLTTLQESQTTGYPTDVPIKSYDFQAPLGEFGQERASFRKLKVFHYFLNDFGSELAPMSVYAPTETPRGPDDLSLIRASARSDGQHGFLFVNNYVRGAAMLARRNIQFEILLPNTKLRIPEKPVDVPSGAYFIWPFNLELGASTLKFATAQLFTRLTTSAGEVYFFTETAGIPAEFIMKDDPDISVVADGALVQRHGGEIYISGIAAGSDHGVRIRRGSSPGVRLILLTSEDAQNSWKAGLNGSVHLVKTEQDFFADEKSFVLESAGNSHCDFTLFPPADGNLSMAGGTLKVREANGTSHYAGSAPEDQPVIKIEKVRSAGKVPLVKLGPALSWRPHGVAMAPSDSEFELASKWLISISHVPESPTIGNRFLRIAYTGDVARLSTEGHLMDDNFYNGTPWMVGLRRFTESMGDRPIELRILPLRRDAPVYIEEQFKPKFENRDQIEDLESLKLIPEYKFRIEAKH